MADADLTKAGLVLHLESDQGVSQSQNIVTHGWDQSGEDNSLTSVGGPRVVENALNRRPVIELDGTGSRLERTSDVVLPESNDDRTVVLLVKYANSSAGGLSYGAPICNGAFKAGVNDAGQPTIHDFNMVADQLVIGGSLDGSQFETMQIAAAFIWNTAISEEEMTGVEGYLIKKYLRETLPEEEFSGLEPIPAQPTPVEPEPEPVPEPAPAPEPAPTEPDPSVAISSTNIVGGGVRLDWSSANANNCETRGPWADQNVPVNGQQTVPNAAIGDTFTLNCSNTAGSAVAMVSVVDKTLRITWSPHPESLGNATEHLLSYGERSRDYSTTVAVPASQAGRNITIGPGPLHIAIQARAPDRTTGDFSNELVFTVQ